jgi:hypothetical protein
MPGQSRSLRHRRAAPGRLSAVRAASPGAEPCDLGKAARGLADMAADFHFNLAQPATRLMGIRSWTTRDSFAAIVGNRSLAQIAEASAWWHDTQADIRASLSAAHPLSDLQVNSAPELQAWEALWDYASAIMTGALELDAAGLRSGLAARQRAGRYGAQTFACYDATTPEAVSHAWTRYSGIM